MKLKGVCNECGAEFTYSRSTAIGRPRLICDDCRVPAPAPTLRQLIDEIAQSQRRVESTLDRLEKRGGK